MSPFSDRPRNARSSLRFTLLMEIRNSVTQASRTPKLIAESEPTTAPGILHRTASSQLVLDMPVAEQGA
jgi:hypothetical protein